MDLKHAPKCRLVNCISNEVVLINLNGHRESEGDILILGNKC